MPHHKKNCDMNLGVIPRVFEDTYKDVAFFLGQNQKHKKLPLPGFEPGSPGWKPGILTGLDDNGMILKWGILSYLKFTLYKKRQIFL